ncbi:hypothetical protein O6H91_07G060300 [Diphasiastrum complanatum]|uniref:Uncharacterized protein n=4 Tax=Diphasiastrum complanatum TaxID=34168 RepID=A0ACC2D6M3_DIPCM|nr:hypothetical protein O6H91_07G060300 [Diphasiastrum complanatum]KAJ7549616.1 hypothetical protein O6H91_07G060300 [Diphasiastrum complanatum]KAJ7549617.1 hypothetical protein O6H91_07G060300 [Diphasiastrum complanatum]KAJ7549618.1 hypothetical protein O6H91_07G060300 [Diphasiastrum complanatum]
MSPNRIDSSSPSGTSTLNPYWEPPPSGNVNSSTARSSLLTPGIVVVVVILGVAFMLVSYYRVFGRFCCAWPRFRFGRHRRSLNNDQLDFDFEVNFNVVTNGLEDSLIEKIPAYLYKNGDGLIESTDCSICLNEFLDNDKLRLLPKCSHAFHVSCIDVWLKSHSNCPLCRAPILSQTSTTTLPPDQMQNAPLQILPFLPESVDEDQDQAVPPSSPLPSDADFVFCTLQQRMRDEEDRGTYRVTQVESLSGPLGIEDPRSYAIPLKMRLLNRAFSLPERKHGDKTRSHPMRRHSSTRRQPFPQLRRLNSTGSFRDGLPETIDRRRQDRQSNMSKDVDATPAVLLEYGNASSTWIADGFTIVDITSMASSSSNAQIGISPSSSEMILERMSCSQELKPCSSNTEIHKASKPTSFSHELRTKGKLEDDDSAVLRKSWSHTAAYRMKRSFSGGRLFQLLNNRRNLYEMLRHPI